MVYAVNTLDGNERPFPDRVAILRRELGKARTFNAVMAVLSMADDTVLREVERDYFLLPSKPYQLRERLAQAHLRRINRRREEFDLSRFKPATLQQLATYTLFEFLPGFTDVLPEVGGHCRIQLIDAAKDQSQASVFEVTDGDGAGDVRRFCVSVVVQEMTGALE